MRLHLPKTLLAAVLAACASLDAYAGVSGSAFEINSTEINDSESMSGYATFADGKYSSVNTDPTDKTAVITIRPGDSTTGTIEVLNVASDKALSISANGTSNFTDLTISRINVAENGSATLNIAGAQVVKIGGQSGTVNFSVSGTGAGDLIFNGSGEYGDYSTSTANYTRKIQVTNSSTVTFDAITNSWGMGGIDVAAASKLEAASIILKSGDNTGGDLQGGKITGDGSANVTTLDVGNVGNYTINVANFEAGTLNANWRDASKQLTLSSSTLTIGTLNQTNGTIKITSATSAAITSLNISGGIIDASEMTGTLTISGATWTGNLTEASVEVLKAKDADAATSLANSMNTTHGLNYSFSVTESSVYRVRRTESLTSLIAKLEDSSDERKRIVVDATTDDGQIFTGVYLKDLLAGDKVTFGDISGWIGSGGETILADLEFSDECTTHVTDGNAGGKITYSGTITGGGTLSFDWYNTSTKQTYEFTGDLSRFTGQIRDDAVLSVTIGGTPAIGAAKEVNATIDIAGALTVNREASFAKAITVGGALTVNREASFAGSISVGGALIIGADATFSNTVQAGGNIKVTSDVFRVEKSATTNAELDLSNGDTSTGCVEIASKASLTVKTNIWGRFTETFASKILLEKDANLVWNGFTITGKTAKDGMETGLRFGENNKKLASDNSAHSVTNSVITSTGTKTLSWTLTDTDLVVQSGTLRLGANVNASNVTVRNGSTLELVSEWTQSFTSVNTNWEAGSTLKYVHTAPGMDAIDVVNLDSGVGSGATIELNGVKGTLKSVVSSIAADIKLTNSSVAAGEFTTIEGDSYTFDGKVKGGGNFVLAQASKTTSLIFNGDLSEWTSGSDTYAGLRVISGTVNATISGTPTNEVVKNAFNKESGGTLNLTIDRDAVLTNKINITSLAVNTGKTLSLSDDNNAVAVGSTTVGEKAKLVIGNKGESTSINLGTVSGSGTISSEREATQSVTLGTGEDNAFTGTLEATAGQLNVTAKTVQTLAGLKANGGNIDVMNATSLSVTDMVIGDNATVGVYSGADTTTEPSLNIYGSVNSKASLTIGSDATLNANLSVTHAKLKFNGGPLAMGESTLTLFADRSSELLGIDLTTVTATGLTLFTGVDGFSTGFDSASANAVTIDDAHDIFGNLTAGAYSLKYTGGTNGDVLLIANNPTPEPTTATLSLLALMGLAARRRRKA